MAQRVFNDSTPVGQSMESRVATLEANHDNMAATLIRIENKLDNGFVSYHEFWPVRTIVYVGAGTVMLAVLTAVITLVMRVS